MWLYTGRETYLDSHPKEVGDLKSVLRHSHYQVRPPPPFFIKPIIPMRCPKGTSPMSSACLTNSGLTVNIGAALLYRRFCCKCA